MLKNEPADNKMQYLKKKNQIDNEDPDFATQNCLKVWKRDLVGQECLVIRVVEKGWILTVANKGVFCDAFLSWFYSQS